MVLSQHWLNHIVGWQCSGLPQAAYCCAHDLKANSFTGRLNEFRKNINSSPAELIPVQTTAVEKQSSTNKLVLTVKSCGQVFPSTFRRDGATCQRFMCEFGVR